MSQLCTNIHNIILIYLHPAQLIPYINEHPLKSTNLTYNSYKALVSPKATIHTHKCTYTNTHILAPHILPLTIKFEFYNLISQIPNLTITGLYIRESSNTRTTATKLATLIKNPKLKTFALNNPALTHIHIPHHILHLNLTNCQSLRQILSLNLPLIQTFNISHSQINNISHLIAPNLKIIDISFTLISSLSSLSSCTKLTHLYAAHTYVHDISPLTTCLSLQSIELHNTNTQDLSPLRNHTKIKYISLKFTDICDISPLLNSRLCLKTLILDNPDIQTLNKFTNLTTFRTTFEDTTSFHIKTKLKNLKSIEMFQFPTSSLTILSHSTNLQTLIIHPNNNLTTLHPLHPRLHSLQTLTLIGCHNLCDFSEISQCLNLTSLNISGSNHPSSDLPIRLTVSVLQTLNLTNLITLKTFIMDQTDITTTSFLSPCTNLTKLHLTNCPHLCSISSIYPFTLTNVNLAGCNSLHDVSILSSSTNLKTLNISGTYSYERFPQWSYFQISNNYGNHMYMRNLPTINWSQLVNLKKIIMEYSTESNLFFLNPCTSIQHIVLNCCKNLQSLDGLNTSSHKNLTYIEAKRCPKLIVNTNDYFGIQITLHNA